MIEEIMSRKRAKIRARLKEEARLIRLALKYEGLDPLHTDIAGVTFCTCNPYAAQLRHLDAVLAPRSEWRPGIPSPEGGLRLAADVG